MHIFFLKWSISLRLIFLFIGCSTLKQSKGKTKFGVVLHILEDFRSVSAFYFEIHSLSFNSFLLTFARYDKN